MSVIKSKRNTAESEFVNSARILHAYTYQRSGKFPKSQTFRYGTMITHAVDVILENALNADRVHINTPHDAQRRLEFINIAQAACDMLDSALEEGREACGISFKQLEQWAELLDNEEQMLHGQEKYCRKTLKDLRKNNQ